MTEAIYSEIYDFIKHRLLAALSVNTWVLSACIVLTIEGVKPN